MYEQAEKLKENRSQAVVNSVVQTKNNGKQGFGFIDSRAEAVSQRKLNKMANRGPRGLKMNSSVLVAQRAEINATSAAVREFHLGSSKYFTAAKYGATLSTDTATTDQEINDLKSEAYIKKQKLNQRQSAVTPNPIYTFDLQKSPHNNARSTYGYNNPKKDSVEGLQILSKGLNANTPTRTAADEADANWHKTHARYKSSRPGSVQLDFDFDSAILGHTEGAGHDGASGHFNTVGHIQDKSANTNWNQDPNNYWGPEEQGESAASGSSSPAYRVPLEETGSYAGWL